MTSSCYLIFVVTNLTRELENASYYVYFDSQIVSGKASLNVK